MSPGGSGSVLSVQGLSATVAGRRVLEDVSIEVRSGEVHAVMGPNGAGKSSLGNVLMGRPGYEVVAGSVTLDGADLLSASVFERAAAGLFLCQQDPEEIPGVPVAAALAAALEAAGRTDELATLAEVLLEEAAEVGLAPAVLERGMNVDLSGGERKRLETIQLSVLAPRFAILDELDSGLDVDALGALARRIERATSAPARGGGVSPGMLVITHYRRLLEVLLPDVVHVMVAGRIVDQGGAELAEAVDRSGYAIYQSAAS